jgi:hypothetical protein
MIWPMPPSSGQRIDGGSMVDSARADLFETASDEWQVAVDRRDFHGAIGIAIEAYLHYREEKNERYAGGALNLMHVAISMLHLGEGGGEAADESCSFCGRHRSETTLGAGPHALICVECVEIFHETLRPRQ